MVVARPPVPELSDLVAAELPDVELVVVDELAAAGEALGRARVLAGRVDDATLARTPRLEWVHSWAAGVDADLSPALAAHPSVLTSSAGNGAVPLAEHAMMMLLLLSRDAPRWFRAQAEHRWDRFEHGELAGRTLGLVGLGNVGTELARRAAAFGMRVVACRRHPDRPAPPEVERVVGPDQLLDLLPGCDAVVVSASLTPGSEGLFDRRAFAALPQGALWVCVSRGRIAEDEALLEALRSGALGGAGIDAHATEPLPPDSPFWDLPNVVVTPHNGATTAATRRRGAEIFVDDLRRFLAGAPLRNVVDKAATSVAAPGPDRAAVASAT